MNVYSNFKVKLIHLYILALIGGGGNHKYIFLLKILEFMVSLVLLLSKQLPQPLNSVMGPIHLNTPSSTETWTKYQNSL